MAHSTTSRTERRLPCGLLAGVATIALSVSVPALAATPSKYRSVARFGFLAHALTIAEGAANKPLSRGDRLEIANDPLAAYWYTLLSARNAAGHPMGRNRVFEPLISTRATRLPLTQATARLAEHLRSGRPPDAWIPRFYGRYRGYGYDAYLIVFDGEMHPLLYELARRREGLNFTLGMVRKFYEWLQDEPPSLSGKIDYYLETYTPWGTSEIVVMRLVELGPPAMEELLRRWRRIRWVEPDRTAKARSDLARIIVMTMYATGDPRLGDTFEREDIPPKAKTVRAMLRLHDRHRTGIDLRYTRAYRFLLWSGSLRGFFGYVPPGWPHFGTDSDEPAAPPASPASPAGAGNP